MRAAIEFHRAWSYFFACSMIVVAAIEPIDAAATTQATCEAKIVQAEEARIIHRMYANPDGINVVVNADTWRAMSFTTKLGLATTIECAIVEPGERLKAVIIRDHRTNKIIGRYSYPNLIVE